MSWLTRDQFVGLRNNLLGLAFGAVLFTVFYQIMPAVKLNNDSDIERLVVAIKALFWGAPLIMAMILKVSFMRLLTPGIDGRVTDMDATLDIDRRVLVNTIEQYILVIPSYCLLALYIDQAHLHGFNALIATFVIARLIFWIGYHHHPLSRSYGFMMTFIPTCVVTIMGVVELL